LETLSKDLGKNGPLTGEQIEAAVAALAGAEASVESKAEFLAALAEDWEGNGR